MINLRGAPLLRPLLIFGFLGLCLVDSFSRINGYKNHWRDIWVGWIIGFLTAIFLVSNQDFPYVNLSIVQKTLKILDCTIIFGFLKKSKKLNFL
jgi:uncharacterized integral membrane protein